MQTRLSRTRFHSTLFIVKLHKQKKKFKFKLQICFDKQIIRARNSLLFIIFYYKSRLFFGKKKEVKMLIKLWVSASVNKYGFAVRYFTLHVLREQKKYSTWLRNETSSKTREAKKQTILRSCLVSLELKSFTWQNEQTTNSQMCIHNTLINACNCK